MLRLKKVAAARRRLDELNRKTLAITETVAAESKTSLIWNSPSTATDGPVVNDGPGAKDRSKVSDGPGVTEASPYNRLLGVRSILCLGRTPPQ